MNDFDSWMPGHYAFGRNTPSSTSATTANAYREYWPDEVRSCPTNEMSTALKSSNGFYQHYMYPLGQFYTEAKSYIHPSGVVVPGYVRMVKATASAALGQIKPFGTLPLISDPCYYYAPTGGMNFTAHANGSGQVPIGWNVPFMMPEGQNSAWLDGHVEWNNTPAWWTRFADCTEAYNTVMVPTNSFQEGWTRLYGSRWVTWTKK
jgi:prepilin-type processing-associated H-X9-DG protein